MSTEPSLNKDHEVAQLLQWNRGATDQSRCRWRPASADNEATGLRMPVLPVTAPWIKTAVETTAEEAAAPVGWPGRW